MKIYYNTNGWVCQRYPYDIPIDDENRFIEVTEEEGSVTFTSPQYYAWRVVDGALVNQLYEVKQWIVEERVVERQKLHEKTDADFLKFSRNIRAGVDVEHSQIVLDYIDQYNLDVSNTTSQPGYPQVVSYPIYNLP